MSGIEIIGNWKQGKFIPVDMGQLELADRSFRKKDQDVRGVFSFPRNSRQHRLLFALLSIVADNSETYDTPEKALIPLKILTGHTDAHALEGKVYWTPKSISYAAMSQAEFGPWFDYALQIVTSKLIPGTAPEAIKQRIFEMTGLRP